MSTWETYWRAGYTVRGASDVVVNRYAKSKEQATREAHEAAVDDLTRLLELGIGGDVDVWVQKWRTRRVEESDDREVVDTRNVARRSEVVER